MKDLVFISLVFFISLTSSSAWGVELPAGYEKARWGMTVEELSKIADITDVVSLGKFYAEHFEWKPDVYVSYLPPDFQKIEYYFYNNKLYKIFIMYKLKKSKFKNPLKYFESIVNHAINTYGEPQASYEDDRFGFPIWHNIWEDNITRMDIRMGSRFIHKVLVHKGLSKEKSLELDNKMQKQKKQQALWLKNSYQLTPCYTVLILPQFQHSVN